MATREENIKKIEHELEALSDEELEKIAGGTYNETAGDSRFLNDLAGLTDRYGAARTFFAHEGGISDEVIQGWSKVGISALTGWGGSNQYFLNGKEISREDAMRHAAKQYGKTLDDMNFTDY